MATTLRFSKELHGVIFASTLAQHGNRIDIECSKEDLRECKRRVMKHNQGAWPIGLRVRVT